MMMSESKTPFEKANAKPEVQRWTGAVSANDGGGFVTYGDYLDVWRKVQRQFDSLDGLEHRARKAESDLAAALAERDALAARVEKAEASRWQPIETCPESCRGEYPKYVLFYNGYHIGVGFCYPSEDGDGGTLYLDEIDEIVTPRPTHWMPPPLPPGNDAALSREEKS
jgi:hypothetical protein